MILKRTISYLLTFLLLICFVLPGTGYAADLSSDSTKNLREKVEEKSSEASDDIMELTFLREDKDGDALAGSVIKVFDQDDEVVFKGKTNKKGICTWEEAEPGEYYLKETKAPEGEKRQKKKYSFELADGKIDGESKVTFGKITVTVDSAAEDIDDTEDDEDLDEDNEDNEDSTEIDSEDKAPNEVTEDESDKDTEEDESTAEEDDRTDEEDSSKEEDEPKRPSTSTNGSGLKDGPTYVAPDVSMPNDGKEIANSTNEDDVLVIITNTAQDGKDNDQPIQNAEFTIYDENGKEVHKGLTDKDGELMCYLPPGSYTMKQTFTPAGYMSAGDDLAFKVYENGRVIGDVDIVSKPGSDGPSTGKDDNTSESTGGEVQVELVITNENVTTGNAVIGAEISVEDAKGNVVTKEQSDKEGKVTIEKLAPGDYKIYQSAAADGYYKSSDTIEISVDDEGRISGDSDRTLKSTPQGTVVITVEDKSSGGVIEGVGLSITNEKGESVFTGTTNANGSVAFVVPELGKYTVKETSVPSDYSLNTSSYTFTVKEGFEINGTTTITNSRVSSGRASTSSAGSYNSPGSSTGSGSDSEDAATVNSEGVPQTGVTDYTVPLVVVSIVLLIIAISAVVLEQRRPDLFKEKILGRGGNSNGES